ncbi:MAG: sigma-70 family RNA polymerase sigma factor [bacterium]|nr:sigma-70 family RNA polymerase sigma factor [bacterium]
MLDDSTVISRCQAGQLELSDILVERYKNQLYSFCLKLTGNSNEAGDLFQDTWVKAFRKINLCAADKRFINWLFTICINLYRDRYRKYYRWLKVVKSYISSDHMDNEMKRIESKEAGPQEMSLKSEQEQTLRIALNSLKDIHRIPLLLFYYRQFSVDEIAQMLGIPNGTVKSRLATGRGLLKGIMEANNE